MNKYVYFDAVGNPVYTASYSNEADIPEAPSGYTSVEVDHSLNDIVIMTSMGLSPSGELCNRGQRPSQYHQWDWAASSWVVPQGAINALVSDKHESIDLERDKRRADGVTYNGVLFDSDVVSTANISSWATAVAANIPVPAGFTWRSKDNQDIPFIAQDILELAAVSLARGTACYMRAWQLKAEVSAMTDYQQIINFDITTGWPD